MKTIDLSPRSELLIESLRSVGYTLQTALADIIDNSVAALAKEVSVRFLWDNGEPWLAIADNGNGMAEGELHEAMRFGCFSPKRVRTKYDMGRFGLGLKTASLSQCRRLLVVSRKTGQLSSCCWDLDEIDKQDNGAWSALCFSEKQILSDPIVGALVKDWFGSRETGTIVIWQKMDFAERGAAQTEEGFSALMNDARSHLELVFHRFLKPERGSVFSKIGIDFNQSELIPIDPFGSWSHPARQELQEEPIMVGEEKISIQPYVLPHHSKVPRSEYEKYGGEEGYLQNQGFYIYRNNRLIVKGTWFRLIRKEELNKLIRVRVDIPNTLDHLWKLDVKKSSAEPPALVIRELKRIISKISGAGRRVYTGKATRILDRDIVSVWHREVKKGAVSYAINPKHPLIKELVEEPDADRRSRNRACLQLISSTFPSDLYFSDIANDDLHLIPTDVSESDLEEQVSRLLEGLREAGLEGADLRKHFESLEFPEAIADLIDKLLNLSENA